MPDKVLKAISHDGVEIKIGDIVYFPIKVTDINDQTGGVGPVEVSGEAIYPGTIYKDYTYDFEAAQVLKHENETQTK